MHVIRESVNADVTYETNVRMHPWIEPFIIRVSSGLGLIVNNFLSDIEDVFATDKPDIQYLRITEELFGEGNELDVSALFQRKLRIFIQASKQIEARDFAINYCVSNTVELSLRYCYVCSHELVKLNINDKEVRKDAPFLPTAPKGMMGYTHVCLSCAYENWERDQNAINDEIVVDSEPMNTDQCEKKSLSSALKPVSDDEAEELSNAEKTELDGVHAEQKRSKQLLNTPPEDTATEADQSIEKEYQKTELIEVFNVKRMKEMLKEQGNRSNLYRNHQRLLNYLGDTAGYLSLTKLPANIFEQLEMLRLDFPNFSGVIDYYFEQFALAQLSEHCVFAANPLLLVGPPGIGKTFFCHALSKIVGTHFELISLAGMTAGFVIGGSSSGWSEGKTGRVVEALARYHVGNPLIVIDECCKSGGDKRYDPLGSLYSLLEKGTASTFVDESLETPTDCSHIVWIGTANSIDKIPDPILSRFSVIEVERPSRLQMENVLRSIYNNMRENHAWGSRFNEDLPRDLIDKIIDSDLEPRKIQKELISACGKAALRHSDKKSSDFQHIILPKDFEPRDIGAPEVRMGFI